MYLASFKFEGKDRIGARIDEAHVIDLAEAAAATSRRAPTTMLELIETGIESIANAQALIEHAAHAHDVRRIPLDAIAWHPPVRRPGKIAGVALNNSASDARKISAPEHPLFFLKPATSLIGHLEDIVVRPSYGSVHPEPELAVVIGRRSKDLDPKRALEAVFGYTILNDITGNGMRAEDMVHYWALYASKTNPNETERREQHLSYTARYKGSDTFGPCGPWLVTRDEIADPHALDVVCRLGSEVIAEDSTAYYTYSVGEVLAFISRHQTLEPGDIVSMGTAFRMGGAKRSLHTADLSKFDGPVEITITGLGMLRNGVRRVPDAALSWRLPK